MPKLATYIMTQDQADQIIDFLMDCGVEIREDDDGEGTLRRRYSGRGMYGAECVGFDIRPSEAAVLGIAFASVYGADVAAHMFVSRETDDMGRRNIIYYFKNIQFEQAAEVSYECAGTIRNGVTTLL